MTRRRAALVLVAVTACSTSPDASEVARSTEASTQPAPRVPTPSTTTPSCWSEPPTSSPLDVGESARVEVATQGGGWVTPDIAGAYWSSDEPVPNGAPENGRLSGTATLVEAEYSSAGWLAAGTIEVEFDRYGTVVFDGPLSCA